VDLAELKELLQILEEKEITEFELEEAGKKLRIRKGVVVQNHASPTPASAPAPVGVPSAAAPPAPAREAGPAPAAAIEAAEANGATIVKSPIVGTFYRSPDPNSPPFVSVGDTVKVGKVLCIIEAMKLMNEIEAEVAGEILKVYPENGQPVQYGEPLFSIRQSR
jgi:acetyl-CoA carboxylase biotin carboxyl carrier protein